MKKVSFFQSIHVKFVIIYVLLILVAMQIIGVYFVRQLEETLRTNFQTSIKERLIYLPIILWKKCERKERPRRPNTLEEDIKKSLRDFQSGDISEVRVIDSNRLKFLELQIPIIKELSGKESTETKNTDESLYRRNQSNSK